MRQERGVSLVMVAMSMMLLLGAAAVAVDLAALRLDRSADQKVTDSAASAGALAVLNGTGVDACEAALAYVGVNAQEIGSIDPSGCAAAFLNPSCDPTSPEVLTLPSVGRFSITVKYPVPNNDPWMTSGLLGGQPQPLVSDDGDPCERVGVQMSATHDSFFAQLLGFDQGTTTVHTVARVEEPGIEGPPLNLVVLDRFGTDGCGALVVQGNGGVIVEKVVDPATGDEFPGVAAADSDAAAGCAGPDPSVIRIDGSDSLLRADGPTCPTAVTPGTGEGCGNIMSLAPGTPGCNPTACTPGAGGGNPPVPEEVIPMAERLTRAQIDHEYNCWSDYTSPPAGVSWAVSALTGGNEQNISGCATGDPAHIYDLINSVGENGPVGGFQNWTALGYPCDVPSSSPPITVSGDVRIDCLDFIVRTNVTFNGNVVFDGNVNVTSAASHLRIINPASGGWAFFRNGTLVKDGQAHLTFDNTMVYLSDSSRVAMSGGTGSLTWVAPDAGPFDDLALWSDSPLVHNWAGQANLTMVGVFFSPWALADYAGTAGQNQTDAQWVADKLVARGQGLLVVTPRFEFPFKVDANPRTTIIR